MMLKKVMVLVIFSLVGLACYGQSLDLESIRANYKKAVSDKKLCLTMIKGLSTVTESSVHLSYLGAFQMIWAKHITNPISKLKTFNTGKKKIEEDQKFIEANNKNITSTHLRSMLEELI